VTARGLTTSRIPYGARAFELMFDFLAHELVFETSEGTVKTLALKPQTVADFYRDCMAMLRGEGIDVKIWHMPVEVPNPIPFDEDTVHRSYDAEKAEVFWRILLSVDAAFQQFRSEFIGKASPVHFFWGSFDLAVTRFSGRRAPERPGADADDARGVFARGEQRGVVAGRRECDGAGVLFVCGTGAGGVQQCARSTGSGAVGHRAGGVFAAVRRCAGQRVAEPGSAGVLPKHVRGGGTIWTVGSRGAGEDGVRQKASEKLLARGV
jgi:hypothetical protein